MAPTPCYDSLEGLLAGAAPAGSLGAGAAVFALEQVRDAGRSLACSSSTAAATATATATATTSATTTTTRIVIVVVVVVVVLAAAAAVVYIVYAPLALPGVLYGIVG